MITLFKLLGLLEHHSQSFQLTLTYDSLNITENHKLNSFFWVCVNTLWGEFFPWHLWGEQQKEQPTILYPLQMVLSFREE